LIREDQNHGHLLGCLLQEADYHIVKVQTLQMQKKTFETVSIASELTVIFRSMAPLPLLPRGISILEYAALFSQILGTLIAVFAFVAWWAYRPSKHSHLTTQPRKVSFTYSLRVWPGWYAVDNEGEYFRLSFGLKLSHSDLTLGTLGHSEANLASECWMLNDLQPRKLQLAYSTSQPNAPPIVDWCR
jgi:hypothetical protein